MNNPMEMPRMAQGPAGMSFNDSVYQRLMRERIVFLRSDVNDDIANELCAQMLLLAADNPEQDIKLYINSPGGSVTAGMAILDTMDYVPCDVATIAMGMAASMGQLLLSAGKKGKRYVLPHARVMMHQPSAGVGGSASDIAIQAEMFGKSKTELAELNAKYTGQTLEQIIKDSDRDRWFTPQEAADYGLVDHVISTGNE